MSDIPDMSYIANANAEMANTISHGMEQATQNAERAITNLRSENAGGELTQSYGDSLGTQGTGGRDEFASTADGFYDDPNAGGPQMWEQPTADQGFDQPRNEDISERSTQPLPENVPDWPTGPLEGEQEPNRDTQPLRTEPLPDADLGEVDRGLGEQVREWQISHTRTQPLQ